MHGAWCFSIAWSNQIKLQLQNLLLISVCLCQKAILFSPTASVVFVVLCRYTIIDWIGVAAVSRWLPQINNYKVQVPLYVHTYIASLFVPVGTL